jgi:RNA polymerase sigma-70 factor (ECF subfamily)
MKEADFATESALSDQALVEAAVNGDADCFSLLVVRHQNRVYRFILKNVNHAADAQDLAQDTFIEAYLNLPGFRGDSGFSTWLLGIALNRIRNYVNRAPERRFNHVSVDLLCELAGTIDNPSIVLEKRELLLAARQGMDRLPPDLRQILILVSFEKISYKEVAEILGIPMGTVKSRLNRAREMLGLYFRERGLSPLGDGIFAREACDPPGEMQNLHAEHE